MSLFCVPLLKRPAQKSQNCENPKHSWDNKGIGAKGNPAYQGNANPNDGAGMPFFFQPLLQKNNNEYGGHDKIQPLGIQLDQRTE